LSNYTEFSTLFFSLPNRTVARALPTTWWRLHAGGGIGEAWTRAKDDVTCSVSDETAPPLA